MLRKRHLFLFIFIGLLSAIFSFPNAFADENGDPIAIENIIADGNFAFPTAEGPAYIQGTDEFQRVPENIIGDNDFEKMRDLPTGSRDYQLGRKVGWIITRSRSNPNLYHTCTGFLVGPDLFMTNHHCINDAAGALPLDGMYIFMDYYQDGAYGGVTARVSSIVRMDATKDYALLRLNASIGNTYGWLELNTTTVPNATQSVKIISHPRGRSKEIVRNNSQIVAVPSLINRYPFLLAYLADSEQGSSGAPVFLRDGTGVIAIHHSAWSNSITGDPLFNAGSLMSYIVPEIQQYLPNAPIVPDPPDPVPRPADLIVEAPVVTDAALRPGESFTLSATVRNQGGAPSTATTLRFYQSTDTTITTADTEIGTANVGALDPDGTATLPLTQTAPTTAGTYIYGACVDTVTDESNTTNNCSPAVTVPVTTAPPDLIVEAPVVTDNYLLPGQSFGLSATVRNRGDTASTATTLRFYEHTDAAAETEIGTADVGTLNPGETATRTLTQTAPNALGMYTYKACVDAVTNESNTDNDCSPAVTVTVTDRLPVYMYWIDAGTDKIQRAHLDGSHIRDIVTTRLRTPTSIAVDVEGGKVYWADTGTDTIQRANLNGAPNIEGLVTTGLRTPNDIEVDITGGKMYWIDSGTDKIQRANLDGSNIEDIITTGLRTPTGIAVDLKWRKVYWVDAGTDKIQRANLDGSNIEDIITTGLRTPTGIAVDLKSDKIYWIDSGTDKIQRANLDGANIEDIVTTGLRTPTGIAVNPGDPLDPENPLGGKVYWIDADTDKVQRANLDGSNIEDLVTTGLRTPTGIALGIPQYVPSRPPGPGATAADVNGDGKVNVVDLVMVAFFYGIRATEGTTLPADVNKDGIVNLLDLTAVATAIDAAGKGRALAAGDLEAVLKAVADIEAAAEAPGRISKGWVTRRNTQAKTPLRANVAAAFADAKHRATEDVRLQKWMPLLKELLLMLAEMRDIPDTTALLPNYPNPFNPETWIPYHLATDAAVVLRIYDIRGSTVRELALGHQAAGIYESRGRAAYWDGKNQLGEHVASGVYFYTLTAGEFTATRKLLIAK